MIPKIKNALGLKWSQIDQRECAGIRFYKVKDICNQVSLSNTSNTVEKVSPQNKRKFVVGEVDNEGDAFDVRPWYVTEEGVYQLLMLNTTDETQKIRNNIATEILPLVKEV